MDIETAINTVLDDLWKDFKLEHTYDTAERQLASRKVSKHLAKQKLLALVREEHDRAVEIGMKRAETAVTIGWNTGTKDLHGLLKIIDREVAVWRTLTTQQKEDEA